MNFDFFLTERFVWWYCGGILGFALLVVVKLVRDARALHAMLRGLYDELAAVDGKIGFANAFEQYNAQVETAFGLAWTEFVETLVLPEPDSSDPIRNTGEVSRYLNDATIIFPRISFGFYQSVPNLLTGLGILGTFIGLAFGVGAASAGLSSSDPSEITSSLQQLLDGASLAFLTSIVGIACSILFVPVDRFFSRRLHLAVDQWVGAIEARLERVTPEGVALQQLEQGRRAVVQLEHFNTELIFSLEKALDEKIAGRLSPQLERLVEAVEGLREDRSSDAGQMIEQALGRFTDAMQERTGSQFEEMASIVADLNRTLKDSAAGLAQSQQDVRVALDQVLTTVRTSMEAGASAMTDTLQQALKDVTRSIADASGQMAERLTSSSTAAAGELAKTGVEAASQISGSLQGLHASAESLERSTRQSEQVLAGMTRFVERLDALRDSMESAHRQMAAVAEPVGRAASEIRASSDRTADTLARTSEVVGRVDALVSALEQHQQSVAGAWTRYQERFEDIDGSLAKVFNQLDEGLAKYCEQVKQFANELDATASKTIGELAAATGELSGSIEDHDLAGVLQELSQAVAELTEYLRRLR